MAAKTLEDLKKLSSKELVAVYNNATGKSITKFSSREAGEQQTLRAVQTGKPAPIIARVISTSKGSPLQKMAALSQTVVAKVKAEEEKDKCPLCGAGPEKITPAGKEGTTAGDQRNFCHGCSKEFWIKSRKEFQRRKPGRDAAKSASESWKDPEVRAARSTHNKVKVGGVEYRSVKAAFEALNLPLGGHIKFRGELKAMGKKKFGEHFFTVVA